MNSSSLTSSCSSQQWQCRKSACMRSNTHARTVIQTRLTLLCTHGRALTQARTMAWSERPSPPPAKNVLKLLRSASTNRSSSVWSVCSGVTISLRYTLRSSTITPRQAASSSVSIDVVCCSCVIMRSKLLKRNEGFVVITAAPMGQRQQKVVGRKAWR